MYIKGLLDVENKAHQEHKRNWAQFMTLQSPKHCVWPQQKFPYQWHHHPLHQASVFRLCLFLFQLRHWLASRPEPMGFKLQFSLKPNWRVETVPTTSGLDQKLAFSQKALRKSLSKYSFSGFKVEDYTLSAEMHLSLSIKREQDDAKVNPVVTRRQLCSNWKREIKR